MVISLIFECIQYVFGLGASDITDIITNTIGGLVGVVIYMLIKTIFNDRIKVKNFITACSMIVMVQFVF